ncbi:MAG: hypothetical protein FWE91_04110 [Defluviitaleaceae bacterium]|nr:hypothetical protein [Defluviitaleaceae bacterium]MCL2837116.1 hypothetical protein [Defluviitaleaceae bacterium]
MSRVKKILVGILTFAILSGISACGRSNNGQIDERITIRLAAPQNAFIENFDTNLYKLWLEEQTGLRIEMTWLPAEDAERIALLSLTTGEGLPDAYIGFGSGNYEIFNNLNLQEYAGWGVIIPLNGLIEQHGVNLKAVWEELAGYDIKQYMTLADGMIYYMPGFSSSLITRYRQVMWVNRGWLDVLDIPVPSTTAEFRDMLIAFKTLSPNRNWAIDEIPLAGTEEHYGKQVYDFLFNAFIYNDEKHGRLLLENGIIGYAPIRDEWREALKYMHGLYQDGLFSPFSFTQSNQQHKQMANDPRDILGAFTSPGITFTVLQNSPEIMRRYVGIGPLTGPGGASYATVSLPLPKPNGVITSAAEHPAEVFKLLDLMLSVEASLMGRYGEYGVDWEYAREGDISIYGTPATIRIINQIWNKSQNKHLNQIVPYISRPGFSNGVTWEGSTTDGEYMNAQAAMLYRGHEPVEFVGEITFAAREECCFPLLRTDLERYLKRNVIAFITGEQDIESDDDWAEYIGGFYYWGLEHYLEIAQTAYNRMKRQSVR